MKYTRRSVFAWNLAAPALGLAMLMSLTAMGQAPEKKSATASRSLTGMEAFRALAPEERLKLVEKLAGANTLFATAKRGDLVAAIVERGVIESADYTDVICKVKARGKDHSIAPTINWIVDEGSVVKKGDLIARLDDSGLRDELAAATLRVKAAENELVRATENARLVRRENAIEVRLAEIDVKLAELEVKDAPPGKSKEALELQVERAKLLHERSVSRAKTQESQADAEKRAREVAKELESERLADVQTELQNCVLLAPTDGFVVYHASRPARFGGTAALIAPGESVREGQMLLRVTPLKQFAFNTLVPESQVSTLRVGQQTQVRVDAIPDKPLRGKVTRVSLVADQSAWRVADTKLYPVTIAIDEPPQGLKPNMSGDVQIVTGERKNVLQVPRKAVVAVDGNQVCFVKSGQGLDERKVIVGAGNGDSIEIREGLKEGEVVVSALIFPVRDGSKIKK
jgi:HlyD family secretion protein